jgi:hypothetical protein
LAIPRTAIPDMEWIGLNSAVQDAHSLCWKVAAVLDDAAADISLDSYDSRPGRLMPATPTGR